MAEGWEWLSQTRGKHIHVRSAAASLRQRVCVGNVPPTSWPTALTHLNVTERLFSHSLLFLFRLSFCLGFVFGLHFLLFGANLRRFVFRA